MVTTSYVVQPTTVVTPARTVVTATQGTSSPQVTVNQSGQTITLTINGTATTNQTAAASPLVGESVASGDAPYLTSLIDGSGRGTVAGLVKARLRQKVVQSGGLSGINFGGLLQEGLKFLLDEFGSGFSFNLNQAVPDILNIINSLLNEQRGGGNNQQGTNGGGSGNLAPGTYQFQGTITINTGGSGGNLTPNPPNNQTGPPNNQTGPTPIPPPLMPSTGIRIPQHRLSVRVHDAAAIEAESGETNDPCSSHFARARVVVFFPGARSIEVSRRDERDGTRDGGPTGERQLPVVVTGRSACS